ncbi:protein CYTOKININ-RESPONSIVE GATA TRANSCRIPTION FACTOR 1 [Elaeis guineensis]|uniref:GATA transcription factor 22 n=1 Tax=Elaeis guineensis var. tenera TaxID=51953 RepID=A0A6I9RFI1_ELAGV|nr:putative GATA transcription factor 22 [Elaeis guineensis]
MNRFSPIPLAEGGRGRDRRHLPPFAVASDTSSFSCSILFNTSQEQGANDGDHHLLQQKPDDHLLISKSSDRLISFPTNNNNNTVEEPSHDRYVSQEDLHGPTKWMSSKMRFMRKMMNSGHVIMSKRRTNMQILQDQGQSNQDGSTSNSSSNSPSGIIRVCSDCNTTKTPLWRSGPRGPKSLCNACGIRQRKARRAMAAAAASGGLIPSGARGKMPKEKKSDVDRTIPFKKRCKNVHAIATTTQKKLCFDDVMISLSKSSAVHRVFPQDERDAALLLMALSWGIICS